jgi:hypothetical protein
MASGEGLTCFGSAFLETTQLSLLWDLLELLTSHY